MIQCSCKQAPGAGQAPQPQAESFSPSHPGPRRPCRETPPSTPRMGQAILGAEPQRSLLPSAPPWQGPSRQGIQLVLILASRAWAAGTAFSGWSYFFIAVFNRKMFPAPPTLSWAGFGNDFQMGNNCQEEEQLKLRAILLPAPSGTFPRWGWRAASGGGRSHEGLLRLAVSPG